jgi:hypothetical protein
MRIVSAVESAWIKPYIGPIKEVNVLRLANLEIPINNSVNVKRSSTVDLEESAKEEEKKKKLEEAKQRFLERKKIKK